MILMSPEVLNRFTFITPIDPYLEIVPATPPQHQFKSCDVMFCLFAMRIILHAVINKMHSLTLCKNESSSRDVKFIVHDVNYYC